MKIKEAMKIKSVIGVVASVIMVTMIVMVTNVAKAAVIADFQTDYSSTQGQDGWYYLYSADGAYHADSTQNQLIWKGIQWYGAGWGDVQEGSTGWSYGFAYQGVANDPVTFCPPDTWIGAAPASVTRWVSDTTDANANISGMVQKSQTVEGDGYVAEVLVNGSSIWSQTVAFNDATNYTFNLTQAITVGDRIDFVARTGSSQTNDVFTMNMTVDAVVPEPASLALLMVGAVALLRRRNVMA